MGLCEGRDEDPPERDSPPRRALKALNPGPSGGAAGPVAIADPVFAHAAEPLQLGAGLWDDWPGLDLSTHNCLNIQLERP